METFNTAVERIPRIAHFEKVSYGEFKRTYLKLYKDTNESIIKDAYEKIKISVRATKESAGYDFITPVGFDIFENDIVIPTGIRCNINSGWFLMLVPRSGLGFKTAARLANTVGIIDSDYYHADNEGHIMVKITPHINHDQVHVDAGDRFCQGIFTIFGITDDDNMNDNNIRHSGIGSTGK